MKREDVKELHYITHVNNVPLMMDQGLLSHCRIAERKIAHISVAMEEIQSRRAKVHVPNGKRLHDYVNLYFNARNAMMYKVKDQYKELCVLRINAAVLKLPGVVIANMNASKGDVTFAPAPEGLENVVACRVFAKWWRDELHKGQMCAEVLVPDCVEPRYITGAYVCCFIAHEKLPSKEQGLVRTYRDYMFFRG